MYVGTSNQLGIAQTVFSVFALKNLFGIGRKKAAFKKLVPGQWVNQFPPEIDWQEYLSKFNGAVRADYEKNRKKKDSILLKNHIATPEDFAAWHFATYGVNSIDTNPDWIPKRKDGTKLTEPPASGKAQVSPVELVAQTVAPPRVEVAPLISPPSSGAPSPTIAAQAVQPSAFDLDALLRVLQPGAAPAPVAAPRPTFSAPMIVGLAVAGIGAVFILSNQRRRR